MVSDEALALLDQIEAREMLSLAWGFTDCSVGEGKVQGLADHIGGGGEGSGEHLIEELIEAKLVVEFQSASSGWRLRSRFAEMMRLATANRQLFPNRPWQNAPRLVADFRVDRRPRRFPRRDRLPADIFAEHGDIIAPSKLRRDLWQALTSRPGMKLAAFQERATARLATPMEDAGTIVTAGTGSGKTMAFYLPAMIRIGEAVSANHWVKAIAIYPRVELLKDQLSEAFRMARSIDKPLRQNGRRPIRIGALFGPTPKRANHKELQDKTWVRRGRDFVCPWISCPTCGGDLLWRKADIDESRERLICAGAECSEVMTEDQIVLTRTRLQRQPPDILFTTTEMLNQRLSDHWTRPLFGVGLRLAKKPFMALLDEVHTYEGTSGAQAALTLRRWRHLLNAPISWVGLSATLGEAGRFFADLTGAHPDRVIEIGPSTDEYEERGAEYQALLRGDPTSRTSLLSTTIQTSMLVPRVLDPPNENTSSGTFGCRAFLFTDDLDVTNRLFDDLRDAEAYTIYGKRDTRRQPLASIRAAGSDGEERDREGQRWQICEHIGHKLNQPLEIGRTTSQDAGVRQSANIVVATKSLEVGFNDPEVGAVIQHKAPRGMASFLQRKGRAGRHSAMRPIMLTVLSDYGRDRAFYQAYEHLFDPTLEQQFLPIRNPYVLKMQAVFALFDWLAERTAGREKAWQWDLLSRPLDNPSKEVDEVIERTKALLIKLIRDEGKVIADLRSYLIGALNIDSETAETLLWEAPRSLMLEAVPTLFRRLLGQWRLAFPETPDDRDLQIDYHPLPDFVPRTLFSDLCLPEVRIVVPPADVNHEERIESLSILQTLNQFVPGRVSRRFAHERRGLSHWMPVDPETTEQDRRISDYAEEHEFVGDFVGRFNDDASDQRFLVFRPWRIRLAKVKHGEVLPSSNARLSWRTDIDSNGGPLPVPIPLRSTWQRYVHSIEFYLHRFQSSVRVRRFAPIAHANIRTPTDDVAVTVQFKSDDRRPAAIGFELDVDGLRLDLALPDAAALADEMLPPKLQAASMHRYLRDRFRDDLNLPTDVNGFQRDWLFQILLSAVLADAAQTGRSLDIVVDDLLDEDRLEDVLRRTMDDVFGAMPQGLQDGEEDGPQADDESDNAEDMDTTNSRPEAGRAVSSTGSSRLQQGLAERLGRPVVRERLRAIARQLHTPDPVSFAAWLRQVILDTLGEAMLQACIAAGPRHATVDTLLVDILSDSDSGQACIWITETTVGGAGVLQAFAERFASEPRTFLSALEAALEPTDLELVDGGMREILTWVLTDQDAAEQIALLRAEDSHEGRVTLWQAFTRDLVRHGSIDLSHALSVSVNNRLLRAGSGPELDQLLLDLQKSWDGIEQRFGLSIGLREFAYLCSSDEALAARVRTFLSKTLPGEAIGHVTVMEAVANLLWPRADEVRQMTLQSYSPYRRARSTDPAILRHSLLRRSVTTVDLADDQWRLQLNDALERHGTCQLTAKADDAAVLRNAIIRLVAAPVDVGMLQFFPVVERVQRAEGRIVVGFALREQV